MSEAKTIPATAINLIDESFDPKKSGSYHLSILLDEKNSAYSILDTKTNKYLALFRAPILKRASDVFSFPHLNERDNISVTCAVAHPKFALVPNALFEDSNKSSLLGFSHIVGNEEKIHSDRLQNLQAKNIFTISKSLEHEIREEFSKVHFVHNATSFIEGLLIQNKNNKNKKVFADFHSSYFEIVILEGSELLFSNAFQYKTPEEIAYYILFVYEQLHLNPEEVELTLSGEIEKTAKEHALLYNYVRHVKFASLPDSFKYSYKFGEIQSHKFFSLFNQYLCV